MICAYVAKQIHEKNGLVLNRKKVKALEELLHHKLGYLPFICNTQRGLYIFLDQQDCEEWITNEVEVYIKDLSPLQLQFLTTFTTPSYFHKEIALILNDEAASALSWKNFMSSFLVQLDPFKGEPKSIHSLFKDFVHAVKTLGNEQQLDYLKRKMDVLRQRVEISGLIELEE